MYGLLEISTHLELIKRNLIAAPMTCQATWYIVNLNLIIDLVYE